MKSHLLGSIDTWIFDLDNTLYPASCKLFDQMHVKMAAYVMRRFSVDFSEARHIQRTLFHKYGTTLRGLMVEHGEAPEGFLEMVHDIDYSSVPHSPELALAIEALPGRKLIFTNGTTEHARRTTDRLGITHLFEATFDIVDSEHIPKPDRAPYEKFNALYAIDPGRSAFFEDIARNLEVPHAMGMTTILVESEESAPLAGTGREPHVHHRTPDLQGFLRSAADFRSGS